MDPKKIARLITEDPDTWEDLGIEAPVFNKTWDFPFDLSTIIADAAIVSGLDDIKYELQNIGASITGLVHEDIGDPDFEWGITFTLNDQDGLFWVGGDWTVNYKGQGDRVDGSGFEQLRLNL